MQLELESLAVKHAVFPEKAAPCLCAPADNSLCFATIQSLPEVRAGETWTQSGRKAETSPGFLARWSSIKCQRLLLYKNFLTSFKSQQACHRSLRGPYYA